jgi:hypothetical protein
MQSKQHIYEPNCQEREEAQEDVDDKNVENLLLLITLDVVNKCER